MSERTPWVFRLPPGLREQPGWVFIGTLVGLAGLSYLLGISESTSITRAIGDTWLHFWGGFLFVSGTLTVISTVTANKALEKLALRFMSIGLLLYMGWILVVIPLNRATFTVLLCVSLSVLSEIRVAVLKALLKPLPPSAKAVTEND